MVSQCVDTVAGPMCLDITSKACFELTGKVTLSGESIFGPASIPIADLLTRVQNQKNDPSTGNLMCFQVTESSVYGSCSLCATIDELEISGNSIHYCGTGQFNCSSLIAAPVMQTFNIPCVNLENCSLFNCRNGCNAKGTCSSLGLCECDSGYYGYDCSLHITENCVSGPLFDIECWGVDTKCDSVELIVTRSGRTETTQFASASDFKQFEIVPCKKVISEADLNCEMCLTMENIHPDGTGFTGCPTISMSCNSIPASSERLDCIHMDSTSTCSTSSSESSTGVLNTQIIFGLGIILVLLVVLTIGFLIVKKLGIFAPKPQELYIEDEEPLNVNDSY